MSDGVAQNSGTQAASSGEAAAVAGAAVAGPAVAATIAAAVPAAAQAAAPAAPVQVAAAVATPVAPVAVAAVQPAPAAADCAPPKKKVSHKQDRKKTEEEHARATDSDEDQNLSQPADGCVLPQTGEAAAPVQEGAASTPVYDEGGAGGISNGLLIGAGVLAAVGVGVLALAKDDEDKNAPPVATADTAAVNEGATVNGSVATNDSDPENDTLTFALTGTAPAGLTFNTDGTYVFDANNAAYNSLAAGATQVLTIPYTVSDGRGGTATSTLTITVTGTNDAPTVVADTAAVNEDAVVTGNLRTNDSDPDTGATLTYTVVGTAPAGLTVNADGTYTFDAGNAAYQDLAQGQTRVVTATFAVSDGTAPAVNTTLTITITGTNDAPVAVAATSAATEGGATVTGQLVATDVDQGAELSFSVDPAVPGLTVSSSGAFSFDPTNAAYDSIAAGETRAVVANYTVTDERGATSTSTLTINVTGINDAPTAVADTAAVNEGATLTGSVATNDIDPDQGDVLTFTLNGAAPTGLTFNSNGSFTFDAGNAAYNSLAAGATQVLTIPYTITDAAGASSTAALTITVTGTNDAPVVVAKVDAVTEDATITGDLSIGDTDPDVGDTLSYSVVGTAPAGLTVNSDGTYTFNAANAAYQGLGVGQTQVVTATIAVTDGNGATVNTTLAITVTGTNDVPVVVADVAAGTEDTSIQGDLRTNDSDVDVGDTLTYTLVGNAPAGFTLNSDGTYSLDATDPAYRNLRQGEVQTVTVDYTVTDGNSAAIPSTLTITVTGVIETVNLDIDDDASLASARLFDAGATDFLFTDDDVVASNVIINAFGEDDFIQFDGDVGSYTFASGDFDGDGVADDLSITSNVSGAAGTVILTNSIADGTVVTNEAQADAAIGAASDNFQFIVTQSLDADDDSNVITARTFDAGSGSFRFTDDADVASSAVVINFGANDRIVLEAGNSYSFANRDLDGDNLGNDLEITINKAGGVVSTLVIKDIVDPSAIVFDEARAEVAVNDFLGTTNVDYFQFA